MGGLKMRRSTFSKDPNTGSLTRTGRHQLTPVTLVQYPTGRESHQISTQPCNTVMAEPTSSKMENITALTTQGGDNGISDYDNNVTTIMTREIRITVTSS